MTTAPIGLQLYSVREALNQDFEGTVRKVAALGYRGVETAGFPGTTPAAAKQLFDELGLTVTSAHAGLPLGDKQSEIVDLMGTLGCSYLICPWLKAEDHFATTDQAKQTAAMLNEASVVAQANGFTLGYHNHDFEFNKLADGSYAYDVLVQNLAPEVVLQVDTYWVHVAGLDPAAKVKELGDRAPLLHIKDGPGVRGEPMTAVGTGVVDVPAIVKAGEGYTQWLIVELDACATDMLEAVAQSYHYLTTNGLAVGNK